MTGTEVELVREMHRAFNETGRFLAENANDDVEWAAAREDPDATTHRGPEAIQRYFDSWRETIDGITVEATEMRAVGDRVLAWIRITGTGRDSGVPVEMEQAQVWTFARGKIARVEEYFDREEAERAAGL